ncbi:hypothetical protein Tco_1142765 [Tanacetum coccineum]
MTTLADKAILSGAENHPPMLEKDMTNTPRSKSVGIVNHKAPKELWDRIQLLNARNSLTKHEQRVDDSWFKDKVLLQAQASGQILHEEELAILANLGILEGQATQTVITHNAAYQRMIWMLMTVIVMKLNTAKSLLS